MSSSFLIPPGFPLLAWPFSHRLPVLLQGPQTLKSPPIQMENEEKVRPLCEGGMDPGAAHTSGCPLAGDKGPRVESPSQEACHRPSSAVTSSIGAGLGCCDPACLAPSPVRGSAVFPVLALPPSNSSGGPGQPPRLLPGLLGRARQALLSPRHPSGQRLLGQAGSSVSSQLCGHLAVGP